MFATILLILCWMSYLSYHNMIRMNSTENIDVTWEGITNTFLILFLLFGIYSASLMMENLRTKGGRIATLTTPATPFESWFAKWITYVVLFAAMYMLLFFLADCIRVWIFSMIYSNYNIHIAIMGTNIFEASKMTSHNSIEMMIFAYLFIQSFYVLGSSFFPRHSFLKTTIICFVGGAIFIFGDVIFAKNFLTGGGINFNTGEILVKVVVATIIAFNWIVSYYRYKEMEIIDRL